MSPFQEAADLNNAGVSALVGGNENMAIENMGKSVKLMKVLLENNSIGGSDITRTQSSCMVEIPRMDSSDSIVFNQAIRIPDDVEAISGFDVNIYTSAVIFNLALAHHSKGSVDARSMIKAEKLYCLILKLLDDSTLKAHTALVVKLACINNLSQIRYFNGDQESAREGLIEISLIMTQPKNRAMLDEPDIQALLINVLLLRTPEVASAA